MAHGFASTRLRRMRRTSALRALVREVFVHPEHLIFPIFVTEVDEEVTEIAAMPEIMLLSEDGSLLDDPTLDRLAEIAEELAWAVWTR